MPTKILEAVYRGRHEELATLLSAGPALTICEAAAVGDARRVRELIDADPGVLGQHSDDGWTALHLAAHFGRVDVVGVLLARGARSDATQNGGFTALHEAAFKNDLGLANLLLVHGANLTLRTNDGETAEAIATRLGHTQFARRLRGELA